MIKYSTRDGGEWQIQHEAKPSAVFATRPHPECCILLYTVLLLICWFCVGGLVSIFCSDSSGAMLLGRLVL